MGPFRKQPTRVADRPDRRRNECLAPCKTPLAWPIGNTPRRQFSRENGPDIFPGFSSVALFGRSGASNGQPTRPGPAGGWCLKTRRAAPGDRGPVAPGAASRCFARRKKQRPDTQRGTRSSLVPTVSVGMPPGTLCVRCVRRPDGVGWPGQLLVVRATQGSSVTEEVGMPSWTLCVRNSRRPGRRGASGTAFPRRTVGTSTTWACHPAKNLTILRGAKRPIAQGGLARSCSSSPNDLSAIPRSTLVRAPACASGRSRRRGRPGRAARGRARLRGGRRGCRRRAGKR
jgi:hypothetical protein